MLSFLNSGYLWIKSFHVISMICWMAALLYLPRLFVYHCEAKKGGELDQKLKIMEYRLSKYIMTPAMLSTYGTGLLLLLTPGLVVWSFGWVHAKLFLVLLLGGVHGFMVRCQKCFFDGKNTRPQRFFRILNEVPTLIMIAVVILVIVKPF